MKSRRSKQEQIISVLEALRYSPHPLVATRIAQKANVNTVTLYQLLDILKNKGNIQEFYTGYTLFKITANGILALTNYHKAIEQLE